MNIIKSLNRFQVFKSLKRQAPGDYKRDYLTDVTSWGFRENNRNDFPQQLLQDIENSPVGSACLDVWNEFVGGNGIDESISMQPANNSETIQELIDKIVYDLVHMDGFAVHVSYNANGEKVEFNHQPFEQTRLNCDPSGYVKDIKTNPYFGVYDGTLAYDSRYTKCYYPYNPDPNFVRNQMMNHAKMQAEGKVKYSYPGQIYWCAIERPLHRIYPVPFYYSGINWFRIDSAIAEYHERNINNNFLLSHVLNVYGDPDTPVGEKDEQGNSRETLGSLLERKLKEQASGSKNGGTQLINWYLSEDERLIPEAFPTNANDELFQTLQNLTTDQIAIACKVPTILVGIQQEGRLGNTQEIINSIRVMQSTVKRKQRFLAKNLHKIFYGKIDAQVNDFMPGDLNLVDVLPDWVIDSKALSNEEIRRYIKKNFNVEMDETNTENI